MGLSKSKIDYLTHVWNVAVGCDNSCAYCWARGLAKRIGAAIGCELCETFTPHVHPERLSDVTPRQKPKRIGLGFMTDLFGYYWVPILDRWNREVSAYSRPFLACSIAQRARTCSQHRFIIPTRFPENIPTDIEWPGNVCFLVTCTTQDEADRRLGAALERIRGDALVAANLEPLCGPVSISQSLHDGDSDPPPLSAYEPQSLPLAGVIVGGMSGPLAEPTHPEWVRSLRDQCVEAGVPFYLKQMRDQRGKMIHKPWFEGCQWLQLPAELLLPGENNG